MKHIIHKVLPIQLVLCSNILLAQSTAPFGYYEDALRYSQSDIAGSARVQGMGGTGVATGADISSAMINPAGLGLSRRSEMVGTFGIGVLGSNSFYLNTNTRDSRLHASIPNFGIILSNAKDELQEGKFRGGAFAISFNKITNFQRIFTYEGVNKNNSIIDYWAMNANDFIGLNSLNQESNDYIDNRTTGFSDFESAAYYSRLIDQASEIKTENGVPVDTIFYDNVFSNYLLNNTNQTEVVRSNNGIYQWDFAYGGNYNDKLYFGAGIGLTRINYAITKDYTETNNTHPNFQNLNAFTEYTARGGGVNLKAGLIYRPVDKLRIGLNFNSGTAYSLGSLFGINERMTGTLNSTVNGSGLEVPLLTSINRFGMNTPLKITTGFALVLSKSAILTAEGDLIDYSKAQLKTEHSGANFNGDNRFIANNFQSVINLRAGLEFRHEDLRFRVGYAFFGDPNKAGKSNSFTTSTGIDRSRFAITLGFGYRTLSNYFDFSIVTYPQLNSLYQAYGSVNSNNPFFYQGGPAPIAEIKSSITNINFTYGTFF